MNLQNVRNDFPLLKRRINGKPVIYLDSTATSLKPVQVIQALSGYYRKYTANVFRGIYRLSEEATFEYETAREIIAEFIHAKNSREIVFTRNASESLNLVYYSWAKNYISSSDEIVTSILEHHSNFVPWQQLAKAKGCQMKIWETDQDGVPDYKKLEKLVTPKTKLFTVTSISNVTGTIIDIPRVSLIVKTVNPKCLILVDAAQSVPHMPVDVGKWGADFVVFSGHKMMGPTGIGVLWGKEDLLEMMPPFQFGGDMISEVHLDRTEWNKLPHKFEAGTPHIAGVIGLAAAVKYLSNLGMNYVRQHETRMTDYALKQLSRISGINIFGPPNAADKGGVVAFTLNGVHPHDVAQILDQDNICIRVGFHCAQPLHEFLGCGPTARASFYVYNAEDDVDMLVYGIEKVKQLFR